MASREPQNVPATYKPDLDWDHIRQTILMLNLAVAQIVHSLQDGDESITALGNSFTTIVDNIAKARTATERLTGSADKDVILANCNQASTQIEQAIVAFQFYDRLSQRLSNVAESLASLGGLMGDPLRLHKPYEWQGLQEKIQSRYTQESERQMFEAVLNGASVDEAMHQIEQAQADKPDDEIELF